MTPARFFASTLVCALPQLSIGFVSSPLSIAIPKSIPAELYSGTLLDPCGEDRPNLTGALEKCELYEFILKDHKPLGCSVEESLADEPDGSNLVFVAEVRARAVCLVEESYRRFTFALLPYLTLTCMRCRIILR